MSAAPVVRPAEVDHDGGLSHGFRFDLNQCTGCNACELACSIENQLGWGRSWRQVVTINEDRTPDLPAYHLSLACNHCAEAPCEMACPALAIRRDPRTDAVLIDPDKCMGCKYCSWACPYDAPRFDERANVMGKCTWCHPRLAEGRPPACVEQCPTGALDFGALEGGIEGGIEGAIEGSAETVEIVRGFPDTPAKPSIRFLPLREERREPPETTWQIPQDVLAAFVAARPKRSRTITLRGEWPLLVFTLLASGLVGWMMAATSRLGRPDPRVVLALTAVAMASSALHLGKKTRAWRAVLNLRRSWLSREVAFFGAFAALALAHLTVLPSRAVGVLAACTGLLALFCVDRVYDIVRPRGRPPIHSADTLLTASFVWAVLLGSLPGFLVVAVAKLFLYVARGRRAGWRMGLRIGLGFVAPVLLWTLWPEAWPGWMLLGIAAGETIDRAEFYDELEVVKPG
jgi:DMSO reductase iron-sulfur subunit